MRYSIPLSYNPINVPRLTEVLNRYQGVHHNQLITDFESAMCSVTGSSFAVALNSGTAAIHLALKVLGIGAGDYVLAPTFTYVATINPIRYLGANPVLIDSEQITWNMDPNLVEAAILRLNAEGKKPKAMVVVHTYGMPCQLDRLLEIAKQEKLYLIEDAAESLGSTYKGKMVGTFGDVGIYSFNNNKLVTTYGGGVMVTKNQELASKVRFWANQAREDLSYYEHREIGYNYAMSPLCAAAGISQMPDLQRNVDKRRSNFASYNAALQPIGLLSQSELPGAYSNRWFSAFLFPDRATKQRVTAAMHAAGIETRPLWRPMHQQPIFQRVHVVSQGVAEDQFNRGICLPSGELLTPEELETVLALVKAEI
ncbi:MAG: aminotransferase class I/II-fold pyridoxal phosphate-dependent enzyme [Cyclobacteriaceae bacterium]|nr:aminotransferase class I/II-fold pyridoxal phosphate-dependent enzyme [Cyclobacteriaceae bacterium]UYN85579.1 MAG: aminotransferase class I/II-fold pyridoxal phosphate-dependent enzyme [Cyclobacteriaceae bacterium]